MIQLLSLTLFLLTPLTANEVTQAQLDSIYMEAILFITVFGLMGIISFVYSKKHAKEYKPKDVVLQDIKVDIAKENRVLILSKMLEDGTLTKDEFELLKQYYFN